MAGPNNILLIHNILEMETFQFWVHLHLEWVVTAIPRKLLTQTKFRIKRPTTVSIREFKAILGRCHHHMTGGIWISKLVQIHINSNNILLDSAQRHRCLLLKTKFKWNNSCVGKEAIQTIMCMASNMVRSPKHRITTTLISNGKMKSNSLLTYHRTVISIYSKLVLACVQILLTTLAQLKVWTPLITMVVQASLANPKTIGNQELASPTYELKIWLITTIWLLLKVDVTQTIVMLKWWTLNTVKVNTVSKMFRKHVEVFSY